MMDSEEEQAASFRSLAPHPRSGRVVRREYAVHEEVMFRTEYGGPMVPSDLMVIPDKYLNPPLMCTVNRTTACLREYKCEQAGAELVFVGLGEAIPAHFQTVFWLMEMINRSQDFHGYVVPVEGRTRLTTVMVGKRMQVTGVEERYDPPDEVDVGQRYYDDWPRSEAPIASYVEHCRDKMDDYDRTYEARPMVRMVLGIIPIQYRLLGEEVRTVAQVLRVSFAPGFHGLQFINERLLAREHLVNLNKAEHARIRNWCGSWRTVMNFETSINLRLRGMGIPNTSRVRNLVGTYSALHLLSPFNVLERILNNLRGGFCGAEQRSVGIEPGSLRIHGFPDVSQPGVLQQALGFARHKDEAYQALMSRWCGDFVSMRTGDEAATLPRVLCNDGIKAAINLSVDLSNSVEEMMDAPKDMMPVVLPSIVRALIGYFLETTCDEGSGDHHLLSGCTLDEYIEPHVQNGMEIATRHLIETTYAGIKNVLADIAQAGMFANARQSFRLSLDTMRDRGADLDGIVRSYMRYLGIARAILLRVELMEVLGSMRVVQTARIVEHLLKQDDFCGNIAASLVEMARRMPQPVLLYEQFLLTDQEQTAYYEFVCSLCVYNESARMNSMNLTALLYTLVADIFTFLGTHSHTWIFKQYPTWVMGGNGHLRTAEGEYIIKRKSTGLSSVVKEGADFCFESLATLANVVEPGELCLRFVCLHRATGAQIEKLASVVAMGNTVVSLPYKKTHMAPHILDEALRALDSSALDKAVSRIPRGTGGGEGTTLITTDSSKDTAIRETAMVMQLRGMGPFFLLWGSNVNPDPTCKEKVEALMAAIHITMPGAPALEQGQSVGGTASDDEEDSSSNNNTTTNGEAGGGGDGGRKPSAGCKRMNAIEVDGTEGVSTLPTDPEVRHRLIWSLSVLTAVARRLALHHKLSQCDFEISDTIVMLFDWMVSFLSRFMPFVIGSTVMSSFQRLMQGYLSHGVALTLLITTARHLRSTDNKDYRRAVLSVLVDMESSALSLQALHTSLHTGLTRCVDTNFLWTDKLIAEILGTPVLSLDWLCATLCGRRYTPSEEGIRRDENSPATGFYVGAAGAGDPHAIDRSSPDAVKAANFLRRWMGHPHLQGEFLLVPGLAERTTYLSKQLYFDKYLSVVKDQYRTFLEMIFESSAKTVDLRLLLNNSEIGLRRFCDLLGVPYQSGPDPSNGQGEDGGSRFRAPGMGGAEEGRRAEPNPMLVEGSTAYLFVQKDRVHGGGGGGGHGGGGRGQYPSYGGGHGGTPTIRRVYVNVLVHLFMTALQGPKPLHAENSAEFASNMYQWIARRFLPAQFVPNGVILTEGFEHYDGGVRPLVVRVDRSMMTTDGGVRYDEVFPEYLLRPVSENALRCAVYGPYLIEDTIHMGPLLQQWKLLTGSIFSDGVFRPLPGLVPRAAEVRPTRVYPLRDGSNNRGTLCVNPNGMTCALVRLGPRFLAFEMEACQSLLADNCAAVGPLVHRANAAVRLPLREGAPDGGMCRVGLIMPRCDDRMLGTACPSDAEGWTDYYLNSARVAWPRYFLDFDGNYEVMDDEGARIPVHFDDLDLLPLGTLISVEADVARELGGGTFFPELDDDGEPYELFVGALRYPDECSDRASDPSRVYVLFSNNGRLRLLGVPVEACFVEPRPIPEAASSVPHPPSASQRRGARAGGPEDM